MTFDGEAARRRHHGPARHQPRAWVNYASNAPARLAIVLLDAKPLGIGHPRLRGDQVK